MGDHDSARSALLSELATRALGRRDVLKGMAGVAGLAATSSLIAACTGGSSPSPAASTGGSVAASGSTGASAPASSAAASLTGQVHVGDYHTDTQGEKDGMVAINKAFKEATGVEVVDNIVDHGTFQNQITSYLSGTPDDAFTWFSGYRMRFFAAQGLATPIDDIWQDIAGNYSDAFKTASTGDDNKMYLVP